MAKQTLLFLMVDVEGTTWLWVESTDVVDFTSGFDDGSGTGLYIQPDYVYDDDLYNQQFLCWYVE